MNFSSSGLQITPFGIDGMCYESLETLPIVPDCYGSSNTVKVNHALQFLLSVETSLVRKRNTAEIWVRDLVVSGNHPYNFW